MFDFIDSAIAREKQIKGYSRKKKIELIDQFNKGWKELCINGKFEVSQDVIKDKFIAP